MFVHVLVHVYLVPNGGEAETITRQIKWWIKALTLQSTNLGENADCHLLTVGAGTETNISHSFLSQ